MAPFGNITTERIEDPVPTLTGDDTVNMVNMNAMRVKVFPKFLFMGDFVVVLVYSILLCPSGHKLLMIN